MHVQLNDVLSWIEIELRLLCIQVHHAQSGIV